MDMHNSCFFFVRYLEKFSVQKNLDKILSGQLVWNNFICSLSLYLNYH
jgi:hypothetical protein